MYDVDAFLKDHKLAALTVLHLRPTDAWLTRAHSSSTLWPNGTRHPTPVRHQCVPRCRQSTTGHARTPSTASSSRLLAGTPFWCFARFFFKCFLSLSRSPTHALLQYSLTPTMLSLSPIVKRNVRKSFCVCFSQVFYCIVSQSSYKLGISSGLLYRITVIV